jgi:hypothetical protein
LIARHTLPNSSDHPFGADDFLAVSEMGIVSPNLTKTIQDLNEQWGLMYFTRQPPMPEFAALGDDDGLLIMVPPNRKWYPTSLLSQIHWFRIELAIGEEVHTWEPDWF